MARKNALMSGNKMKKSPQFTIKVLSDNPQDISRLKEELDLELEDKAGLELTQEKAPQIPGRFLDPSLIIEAVSLTVKALEACIIVARVLDQFRSRKPGVTYVLENVETGEKIKIVSSDSTRLIAKKIQKLSAPPGLFSKLFKKNKDKEEPISPLE